MSWILKVKEKFQAAHFLKEYEGKCERIHGHTFQVEVNLRIDKLDNTGIGIDFTEIKKKLTEIKKQYPVKEVTVWESEDASATYFEGK